VAIVRSSVTYAAEDRVEHAAPVAAELLHRDGGDIVVGLLRQKPLVRSHSRKCLRSISIRRDD
jgi:hypothetical protein